MRGLVDAIRAGHEDDALALVEAGADVRQTNPGNYTPLLLAAQRGLSALAVELVSRGADVDSQDMERGLSPLIAAVLGNRPRIVDVLLEGGAHLGRMTHEGLTALEAATKSLEVRKKGEPHAVAAGILARLEGAIEAALGEDGESGLRLAAASGHLEALERMLAAEVRADAPDHWNTAALGFAAIQGHPEIVSRLLAEGADVARITRRLVYFERLSFNDPVGWAVFRGREAVVEAMAGAGVDLDVANMRGETPLMKAAMLGHAGVMTALLEAGVDPQKRNRRGQRALEVAREVGRSTSVALLEGL